MTIPILDSHVHLIDPERLSYRWLPAGDALRCRWDAAGYASAAPGIAGVIVVEAGVTAGQAGKEIAFTRAQAAARPWILGIVAQAPAGETAALRPALPGIVADDMLEPIDHGQYRGRRKARAEQVQPTGPGINELGKQHRPKQQHSHHRHRQQEHRGNETHCLGGRI